MRLGLELIYKASAFRIDGRRHTRMAELLNFSTLDLLQLSAYRETGRRLIGWACLLQLVAFVLLLVALDRLFW